MDLYLEGLYAGDTKQAVTWRSVLDGLTPLFYADPNWFDENGINPEIDSDGNVLTGKTLKQAVQELDRHGKVVVFGSPTGDKKRLFRHLEYPQTIWDKQEEFYELANVPDPDGLAMTFQEAIFEKIDRCILSLKIDAKLNEYKALVRALQMNNGRYHVMTQLYNRCVNEYLSTMNTEKTPKVFWQEHMDWWIRTIRIYKRVKHRQYIIKKLD